MSDSTRLTPSALTCDDVRTLGGSFVLGALEDDEADAVRAHLATCTDAHAELDDLAGVLEVLAASTPVVEPPPSLGPRIRAAAEADVVAGAHRRDGASTAPVPVWDLTGVRTPSPMASKRGRTLTWAVRMAAVVAIALLGTWNLLLQGGVADAQRDRRELQAVLEVAARDGSVTAVLRPEAGAGPTGLAAVARDGSMRLVATGLAPTTGSEVYEAWVIAGDQPPRPLGSFTVDADGVASFAAVGLPVRPGTVLALTREPAPGATTPTLPIVTVGAVAAG